MSGYTKLFGSIIHSSIWAESKETKILWVTLMAMADRDGVVQAAVPGLAKAADLTIEETEAALVVLGAPDKYDRSGVDEGRRVRVVPGGWLLVNHQAYREKASSEQVREKNAERQKRWRDRHPESSNGPVTLRNAPSRPVTSNNDKAEAEAEADPKGSRSSSSTPPGIELAPDSSSATADTPKPPRDPQKDPDVIRVFEFWQKDTGHQKSKLDAKRARRIRARLQEGFTPRDLAIAIRNRKHDPWLSGADPKSPGYDGIETLLRDAAQVERLRDLSGKAKPAGAPVTDLDLERRRKAKAEADAREEARVVAQLDAHRAERERKGEPLNFSKDLRAEVEKLAKGCGID